LPQHWHVVLNILIGCERSGITRDAFIKAGYNAISCDLEETDRPGPHLQGDVFEAMRAFEWDLIILHPDCKAMCVSGNRYYANTSARTKAQRYTARMFKAALEVCGHVALENPVSTLAKVLGKSDSTIQPWQHGHGETKAICWWLHNLPPLEPTNIVDGREPRIHYMSPGPDRSKKRSEWYPGIAAAQATQWGNYITEQQQ
jgi:hypothetical protein